MRGCAKTQDIKPPAVWPGVATSRLSCSRQSGRDDILLDELEDLCGTLGDADAA